MIGNERDDVVVLDDVHVHCAFPDELALTVLEIVVVPAIKRRLIDHAAFDLRQQPVADADQLHAKFRNVDGRDRHAFGIVARQDDAAGETHDRRLVAQLDRDSLFLNQLVAGRVRQAGLQLDVIGRVEIEAGETEALIYNMEATRVAGSMAM